jgi:hypothetical protein
VLRQGQFCDSPVPISRLTACSGRKKQHFCASQGSCERLQGASFLKKPCVRCRQGPALLDMGAQAHAEPSSSLMCALQAAAASGQWLRTRLYVLSASHAVSGHHKFQKHSTNHGSTYSSSSSRSSSCENCKAAGTVDSQVHAGDNRAACSDKLRPHTLSTQAETLRPGRTWMQAPEEVKESMFAAVPCCGMLCGIIRHAYHQACLPYT